MLIAHLYRPNFNGTLEYDANSRKTRDDVEVFAHGMRNPYDVSEIHAITSCLQWTNHSLDLGLDLGLDLDLCLDLDLDLDLTCAWTWTCACSCT